MNTPAKLAQALCIITLTATGNGAHACDDHPPRAAERQPACSMNMYEVSMVRQPGGPPGRSSLVATVQAPTDQMAKHTAQAQWPGYRATNARRVRK